MALQAKAGFGEMTTKQHPHINREGYSDTYTHAEQADTTLWLDSAQEWHIACKLLFTFVCRCYAKIRYLGTECDKLGIDFGQRSRQPHKKNSDIPAYQLVRHNMQACGRKHTKNASKRLEFTDGSFFNGKSS